MYYLLCLRSHFPHSFGHFCAYYSQILPNRTDIQSRRHFNSNFFLLLLKIWPYWGTCRLFCFVWLQYRHKLRMVRLMACQYTVNQLNVSIFWSRYYCFRVHSITLPSKRECFRFAKCIVEYKMIKILKTYANGIIDGPSKIYTPQCELQFMLFCQSSRQSAFNFFLPFRQFKNKKKLEGIYNLLNKPDSRKSKIKCVFHLYIVVVHMRKCSAWHSKVL